jgi:hypothetical protein
MENISYPIVWKHLIEVKAKTPKSTKHKTETAIEVNSNYV